METAIPCVSEELSLSPLCFSLLLSASFTLFCVLHSLPSARWA